MKQNDRVPESGSLNDRMKLRPRGTQLVRHVELRCPGFGRFKRNTWRWKVMAEQREQTYALGFDGDAMAVGSGAARVFVGSRGSVAPLRQSTSPNSASQSGRGTPSHRARHERAISPPPRSIAGGVRRVCRRQLHALRAEQCFSRRLGGTELGKDGSHVLEESSQAGIHV